MRINKSLLAALAATLTLGSCTDFINGFDAKSHEYKVNFEKQFGEIDPNQDWSMAARTTANINLSNMSGNAVVTVFDENPNVTSSAKALGMSVIKDGKGSFDFYSVKGMNNLYVQVKQGAETTHFNQYTVNEGNLYVGEFATRSFSSSCPVTKADTKEIDVNFKKPSEKEYFYNNDWFTYQGWVDKAKSGSINQSNNFTAFTDESTKHWVTVEIDFSEAELKTERVTVLDNGNIQYQYNPEMETWLGVMSVQEWQDLYRQSWNLQAVVDGTYNGPYDNSTLKFIETDCTSGTSGAIYKGLYPEEQWELRAGLETRMGEVDAKVNLQYLSGVEREPAPAWTRGWGYSLYGPGAFFMEQEYYYGKKNNFDKTTLYEKMEGGVSGTLAAIEKGFAIKTSGGKIDIPLVYAATDYTDQFGYVFYKDGEDPLLQPHYILIEDARPATNIYENEWKNGATGGFTYTGMADWMAGMTNLITWKDELTCKCNEQLHDGIYSETNPEHHKECKLNYYNYVDAYNEQCIGTTYRMVYFKEDGTATYDIPAGLNVVFFICPRAKDANPTSRDSYSVNAFNYSLPELNKRISHLYDRTDSPTYEANHAADKGAVKATAWVSDGMTFLGFEDGGSDEDLNDVVFWVDGAFTPQEPTIKRYTIKWHINLEGIHDVTDTDLFAHEDKAKDESFTQPSGEPSILGYEFLGWSTEPDGSTSYSKTVSGTVSDDACYFAIWRPVTPQAAPETVSWIFACEDLGGSFDYDFNDIIWEVSQSTITSGADVTYDDIRVRVLAAGGTLPIKLVYGNTVLGGGEIHTKAFNQSAVDGKFTPVNVAKGGLTAPVLLGRIPANGQPMNLETLKSNFKILVADGESDGVFIEAMRHGEANDKTPQILIFPGNWRWPLEYKGIDTAYPKFPDWVKDSKNAEWMTDMDEDMLIDR